MFANYEDCFHSVLKTTRNQSHPSLDILQNEDPIFLNKAGSKNCFEYNSWLENSPISCINLNQFESDCQYEDGLKPLSNFRDPNDIDMIQLKHPPNDCASLAPIDDCLTKGTTTLGFIYKNGVILATDSRATASDMIVSQRLNKVISVSDSILCTLAGNAGDCVYWLRSLAKQCALWKLKYKEPMTIKHAANLLANMARKHRSMQKSSKFADNLSFSTLMAQYDEQNGPQLYMVDNSGVLLQGAKFSVGSGAEFAQAILDTDYNPDLNDQEAYELATSAIFYACRRDVHSGGFVKVYKINQDGWRQVMKKDVKDIYDEYHGSKSDSMSNQTSSGDH